jgi:hypothetical protein
MDAWAPTECLAIVDAVERAWQIVSTDEMDARIALRQIELLREPACAWARSERAAHPAHPRSSPTR